MHLHDIAQCLGVFATAKPIILRPHCRPLPRQPDTRLGQLRNDGTHGRLGLSPLSHISLYGGTNIKPQAQHVAKTPPTWSIQG